MVITLYELVQALGVSHVELIVPDDQVCPAFLARGGVEPRHHETSIGEDKAMLIPYVGRRSRRTALGSRNPSVTGWCRP